jgi:hypothetical protein
MEQEIADQARTLKLLEVKSRATIERLSTSKNPIRLETKLISSASKSCEICLRRRTVQSCCLPEFVSLAMLWADISKYRARGQRLSGEDVEKARLAGGNCKRF